MNKYIASFAKPGDVQNSTLFNPEGLFNRGSKIIFVVQCLPFSPDIPEPEAISSWYFTDEYPNHVVPGA
ncbi:MAG: hypothetical protein ACQEQO_11795, partial [Thermodesulfobacteriota bacterium]